MLCDSVTTRQLLKCLLTRPTKSYVLGAAVAKGLVKAGVHSTVVTQGTTHTTSRPTQGGFHSAVAT